MDPNKWEMHCGMGQAKKWKASVRVLLRGTARCPWVSGSPAWRGGFSAARARRDARFGPKRAKLRKMKQRGLLDEEEEMYRRLEPMGGETGARGDGAARIDGGARAVSGKSAFVELVPYVVRGAKLRSRGGNNRGGFARAGFGGGELETSTEMLSRSTRLATAVPEPPSPRWRRARRCRSSRACSPRRRGRRTARRRWRGAPRARVAAAAMEAASRAGAMIDEGVGVRERVAEAQRVLRDRVTFGKSNIHGWGLIAKTHIKAGTMVVPFRASPCALPWRTCARRRTNSGRDCYLLMADPRTVIDTTNKGNVAVHEPLVQPEHVHQDRLRRRRENHIIFFTRVDVGAGEELTYNYRFDAESGRVPCYCAHNCRGFLC